MRSEDDYEPFETFQFASRELRGFLPKQLRTTEAIESAKEVAKAACQRDEVNWCSISPWVKLSVCNDWYAERENSAGGDSK
jgi:hypothetical protein